MHREYNILYGLFFEVQHGEGEHDGAGACVKRALDREQLKFEDSVKFQDAHAIMDLCNTNISIGSKDNSTIQ